MKTLLRVLWIAILLAALPAAAQSAWEELKADADKGNPQSQLDYAKVIYATDKNAARDYAQRAANQNNGEAWYWLGYTGLGTDKNVNYYERAAILGYGEAFTYVLDDALFRAGAKADIAKAKKFADSARNMKVNIPDAENKFRIIDLCYAAGKPIVPQSDRPSSAMRAKFTRIGNCGLIPGQVAKNQASWDDYRLCVLSQRDVDGNALAEIYANGWGVKRNPKMAIAMLCHASSVPAELQGMVDEIYKTKDQATLNPPFRFCDHITSGMNAGMCAAQKQSVSEADRAVETANYANKYTAAQQSRFSELQKAAKDYFNEHATSEQDMSGTARGAIAISESERMQADFLQTIKSFEEGTFPDSRNFPQADREMNTLYTNVLAHFNAPKMGTVKADGIRTTQRKWLVYRDAWTKFAAARYPKISSDTINAWTTQQRIETLKTMMGGNNPD